MFGSAPARLTGRCILAFGLVIALGGPLRAGESNPFDGSLASAFLQSRAQIRIYRHDDEEDLNCQFRKFVDAEVVRNPRVVDESLNERKWIERWVLNRCGARVAYDVYFTEVGEGGAIFTFRQLNGSSWQANRFNSR